MGPDQESLAFADELLRIIPRLSEVTNRIELGYALMESADLINAREEAAARATQEPGR